jgi:hypothetical protein
MTAVIEIRNISNTTLVNLRSAHTSTTWPPVGYALDGENNVLLEVGARTWERQLATSPVVHGSIETAARLVDIDGTFTVNVFGSSAASVQSQISTVVGAVSAKSWILYVDPSGTGAATYAWKCRRADVGIGLTRQAIHGVVVPVLVSYQRAPIPISGPL